MVVYLVQSKYYWNWIISQYILILFFFLIILILFKYEIFIHHAGFFYPNVSLNILASIILFLLFGTLPFEKFKNRKYKTALEFITKFTGGIYYSHPIFRDYLRKYTKIFKKGSYSASVMIYIMCYFFCFIGIKLFRNYKLKYLFIWF